MGIVDGGAGTDGSGPSPGDDVDQWFVSRGLPHFIGGYSARDDIWTRAVPVLVLVFLAEVGLTFDSRISGWAQFGLFCAGAAIAAAATALVNRLRGRSSFQVPDDVGAVELALFVLVPAVLIALTPGDRLAGFGLVVGVNLVILAAAYVVTGFGLVSMVRWAVVQLWSQLGRFGELLVKSLPLLVLFSAFLFLNAEIWRVAHDFDNAYFVAVVIGIVALGSVFVALFLAREVEVLGTFASWDEVCGLCDGSPLDGVSAADLTGRPEPPPLTRLERVNVALVLFVSQSIQIVLVVIGVVVAYLAFGLFTVRPPTIAAWIAEPLAAKDVWLHTGALGPTIALTRHLVVVTLFIATFAGFQFTVSVLTDSSYRSEFADELSGEIRESLAVRTLSRALEHP